MGVFLKENAAAPLFREPQQQGKCSSLAMRLKPQTYALTTVTYERRHVFQRDAIAESCIETIFR